MKVRIRASATVSYHKEIEMTQSEYEELVEEVDLVGDELAGDLVDADIRSKDCNEFDWDELEIEEVN